MLRLAFALILSLSLTQASPQALEQTNVRQMEFSRASADRNELPDAPSTFLETRTQPFEKRDNFAERKEFEFQTPVINLSPETHETFHWRALLLQSFAFGAFSNATRIMTANQDDRHLLLNKPFWANYGASMQQYNMHRWNDGDSIKVNYIGHPMEGAIAGYIEVQNDPRGRLFKISRDKHYWNSRFRAFLWEVVYSTQWEIGPFGEAGVFSQGGFTYPIGCKSNDLACEATAKYTNNTGWVDFIITPVVGTLWMIGEDTIDRYISDPLVRAHPGNFGIDMVRAALNPPASVANMMRGHFPWRRDYEHFGQYESEGVTKLNAAMEAPSQQKGDISFYYRTLSLGTNTDGCIDCRNATTGAGVEFGIAARKYLDIIVDVGHQPHASPMSSLNVGGSLTTANFGLRSGYSGPHFAAKVSLAPGFASYSDSQPEPTDSDSNPGTRRNFNFSLLGRVSGDVRFTPHLAARMSLDQMLIRYKSTVRDPPGIGTPPRLYFMSHDNYVNSTNWGMTVGPVITF